MWISYLLSIELYRIDVTYHHWIFKKIRTTVSCIVISLSCWCVWAKMCWTLLFVEIEFMWVPVLLYHIWVNNLWLLVLNCRQCWFHAFICPVYQCCGMDRVFWVCGIVIWSCFCLEVDIDGVICHMHMWIIILRSDSMYVL